MDIKLTTDDVWFSTWIFGGLGLLTLIPLGFAFRNPIFRTAARPVIVASALLWGIMATIVFFGFWHLYYQYLFKAWMRWLAPLDGLLYAAFGIGMWWLAQRLPGPTIVWFVLFGGLEGVAEHIFGIYRLHILELVPWLRGVAPLPVILFSFGEYILYWSLVGWLAYCLAKIGV